MANGRGIFRAKRGRWHFDHSLSFPLAIGPSQLCLMLLRAEKVPSAQPIDASVAEAETNQIEAALDSVSLFSRLMKERFKE
ncbi:hypothetical protein E2C01_006347 [Portunus trituberculatus]|uniref:Uncharacterized protein n=1 Tax=Portunus trituberculatus TaxID=210409 RepID=A0A5B7CUU6_PORTR|nr:hypothetical protein [Portunus trituberculatus]